MPDIDDGAENNEDTLKLIDTLSSYGFSQFITTPHVLTGVWNNTKDDILQKEEYTKALLKNKDIKLPFKAAAEYLMDDVFLKLLQNEELLTIKDEYVLVEMSYLNPPMQLYDILFELQLKGYKPILAHPERYNAYHNNYKEFEKLKKAGCLFQINLLSTTGYYGKPVFKTCEKLLNDGMIDYTGSDVHHTRHASAFKNPVLLKDTSVLEKALKNNSLFSI
ncbi:capsular polysaccharide biosynthesis protein [Flavobacterium suaedae]|uniref:protein-tyrosine-phosphatase n=2 Tax=Flavobacterium suaedae TaxID=1767027 RepID=A0ABQ1JMN3_9FLAO|nr:capsular polysaccharide biosynthesis protein [Flavobacterium suaedae]